MMMRDENENDERGESGYKKMTMKKKNFRINFEATTKTYLEMSD